jgi:endonuclease/exonuclease/phosphatase family metal-dependent hydrolase
MSEDLYMPRGITYIVVSRMALRPQLTCDSPTVGTARGASKEKRIPMIRIMTFNINGSMSDEADTNAWQKRAALNVKTIKRHAPDLIGFQEVEPGNLEDYRQTLAEYDHVVGNKYDLDPYAGYTSIFWKSSKIELLEAGEFWLSRTPDEASSDWGVPYPLGATWVKLRDVATGLPLLHMNTHLEDGDDGELSRVEGSKLIIERITQLQAGHIPAFVTGDFNCNSESVTYSIFKNTGFTDTYLAGGNTDGKDSTFHGYEGEHYSAFKYSGGRNTYWRVDWILTRDGKQHIETRSCAIVRDAEPPLYPSDHYPVLAEVALVS